MRLRHAAKGDFDAIVSFFDEGRAFYDEPFGWEEDLRQWLTSPKLDPARDIRLAYEGDRLVGYADVDPLGENPVRWWCCVRPHPDADFAAVVPPLLEWAASRAGEGLIRTWAPSAVEPLRRAFERGGLRRIRSSYRMEIELTDGHLAAGPLPEGIEVRMLRPSDEPVAYEVHEETFEDSWEHVREPYDEWRHYLVETESFDRSLWFLAWDGAEPAAIAICRVRDAEVGWVEILGVRRPWRRRGLGRTLLLHAFGEFRRRGLARAGLGVDAESLTGANRLYESVGMRAARRLDFFERPLG